MSDGTSPHRCGWGGCKNQVENPDDLCSKCDEEKQRTIREVVDGLNDGSTQVTVCRGPHPWDEDDGE